ncbi:MAG TPA: DapH/DapD/GlmU-related protein [Bacteroidia bacterium]|nr:DapH/DapD/GlmU-related protein [Bacteroidia bacterium]
MISIDEFIEHFTQIFTGSVNQNPWEVSTKLHEIIFRMIDTLDTNFVISNGIAIHKTAIIEERVIMKAPIIINENCFVGANSYLRNGVYLGKSSSVGPGCEVKTSIIFNHTEIAHLNFIGDSIIGSNVNFEAGSVTANYFNERNEKIISVNYNSKIIKTNVTKFGSLVGDNCKIGANAVLSPGTILNPGTIVKRLELVDQIR